MKNQPWNWYLILVLFYLGIGFQVWQFEEKASYIQTFKVDPDLPGLFAGNDWVTWENTSNGVMAKRVHPLPGYRPLDKTRIKEGDRLKELDFEMVTRAGMVDTTTWAAQPGHIFWTTIERPDPYNQIVEEMKDALIINGFRLSFSFNEFGIYWQLSGWIVGLGTFLGLIVLVILLPLVRGSFRSYLPLTSIVLVAFVFFFIQLLRHVYLIVESDLENVRVERIYMMLYILLLMAYSVTYFYFKAGNRRMRWIILPSMILAGYMVYRVYEIAYLQENLKHYHDLIEGYCLIFFFWHIVGALGLFLSKQWRYQSTRGLIGLSGAILFSLLASAFYLSPANHDILNREHVWFAASFMLFFPLINASYLQLQFGKVSLVVTQTFQYLVTFIFAIVLYLLISQLFDYVQFNVEYRRILEFITFLLLMMVAGLAYRANEARFTKYFVSSQREKLTKFKSFTARIPQYTNARTLEEDLKQEIRDYFNTDTPQLWWSDMEEEEYESDLPAFDQIYQHLTENQTIWSKTKEIAPYILPDQHEEAVLSSPYTLIAPIKVDDERFALLLLNKKKRGVYNLSDLELISQMVQQTQLTLAVLNLLEREKDLVEQNYEARLTALRSQINPHFLFNTLNSIGELVYESAEKAEMAVEKLAHIFRFTLNKSSEKYMTVSEEMSLIKTYLELEQIRFGERLRMEIEVAPDIKDVPVPAFILQTLVENCIKHGIAKILHKGYVGVKAFRQGEFLVCEVVDNGPGIDLSRIFKSTGLSNSIARMENIYNMKNLLYFENTGNGTLVRMKVPLEKEKVSVR